MNMSDDNTKRAIASLIERALRRIRELAVEGDTAGLENESYHIHNLPMILVKFSEDALMYYWNVERPEYLSKGGSRSVHARDWAVIEDYIKRTK